jgi:hypothetical protein
MRRNLLIAATAAAIVALPTGVSAYVWFAQGDPDRLAEAIDGLGFFPITPPTLLRNPGSIYLISRNVRSIAPICEATPEQREKVVQRSASEARVSNELRKASYGVSAKVTKQVESNVEAEVLQSTTVSLDKVAVLEVSLENLAQVSLELQERPHCQTEILKYLKAGDYVCQVQTVLMASAKYTLKRQAAAHGSGKIDTEALHGAIKANLDPTAEVVGDLQVVGDGLYYGMKFTPRCMAMVGDDPPRLPLRWHERVRRWAGLFS